jgi:hypothetical protein
MNGEPKGRLQEIGAALGVDSEDIGRMRKRTNRLRFLKLIVGGLSPMVAIVLGFLYGASTLPKPPVSMYPYLASVLLAAGPIDPRLRAAMVSREGLKRRAPLIGVIVLTVTGFIVGWLIGGAHQVYGPSPKYGVYSQGSSGSGLVSTKSTEREA